MALPDILKSLSTEQYSGLRKFLQSPYFTSEAKNHRQESLLALFDFLQKQYSKQDEYDPEVAFARVFPGRAYAPGTIKALASALHGLVKKFISLEQDRFLQAEHRQMLALARFFREKGLTDQFEKNIGELFENLSQVPEEQRDSDYLYLHFQAHAEMALYQSLYKPNTGDLFLGKTLFSLDVFYINLKTEYAASFYYQRRLVDLNPEELLPIHALLPLLQEQGNLRLPAVRCFAAAVAYLLETDKAENHLADFQQLLLEHSAELPFEKRKVLYALERNFCVSQYVRGNADYLPKLFDMYCRQLDENILYENDCLTQSLFLNIVRVGLKMKQLDWVWNFLEKHRYRIAGARRPQEVYDYNMALYFFYRGDFAATLRHLKQRYEDNYYILDANMLELKLYFERRQWVLLDNKLNSFKVNIFKKSKDWLPATRFNAINQFLNFLRQVLNDDILVHRKPKLTMALLEKIKSTAIVAEKDWLIEKLESLQIKEHLQKHQGGF